MKLFTSKSQKIGELGEKIACIFLTKNNFKVIGKNYTKKYGEIDIIAKKAKSLHFIEVKSVSCEISSNHVIHETFHVRPEENLHHFKLRRLHNTIQAYLIENEIKENQLWQLDLICVYLDVLNKKAKIESFENIIM